MKVLAVLSLLCLVAAEPQLLLPYSSSLLSPTIKTDGGVISTYTATYPYAGVPTIRTPLTYSLGLNPYSFPTVIAAKPVVTPARQKRSADPEPAINFPSTLALRTTSTPAATIPATLATIPTTLNYQYTGLPGAVTTYSVPQTLPQTLPYTSLLGAYPYTGLTPYTTNWPFLHPVVTTTKVETPKAEGVTRAKRSADPEADPQLLTTGTGVTGFTYPAVNTGTVVPRAYSIQNLPINYPTTYTTGNIYSTGFPYNTLPLTTVYG